MVSAFFKKEKVKYPSRSFKMNDPSLFHWDFLRQQPAISMAPTFMDIRAKDLGVEHAEGMSSVGARSQWERYSSLHSILELRKEKSRDAARSRRGKENYEFYELAKLLPLPAAITSQLDKASIIRLSISYLKLRDFSGHGDPPWNREGMPPNKSVKGGPLRRRSMTAVAMEMFETHQGTHILQSLDGFAFSLANDGRFLYISETVSIYLGLSQVEMTGSSIFDYVHQQDHPELADQLGLCIPQGTCTTTGGSIPSPGSNSDESSTTSTPRSITPPLVERATVMNPNPNKGYNRAFCLRMKSTLTKRGVHVKTSGYRVVHIVGHFRPQMTFTMNRKHPAPLLGMVALALAMPPPTITELRIESDVFITRLNPEFRVLYCEPIIADLMDLSAEDLTHKMLYDFCHAGDLQKLRKVHTDLLAKGQVLSEYYRLLNKHGGYIWLQTCATTICNAKNVEDQNIIAINYVLSGVEYGNCVLDANQLHTGAGSENDHSDHTDHSENGSDYDESHLKNKKSSDHKEGSLKVNQNNSCLSQSDRLKQPISEADDSLIDSGMQKCDLNCNNVYQDEESAKIVLNNRCCSIYAERSDASKVDSKNSRRKADKPRRRRREHENEDDGFNGSELLAEQKDGGSTKVPRLVRPAEEKSPVGKECHVGLVRSQDKLTSVPEDLSTKPIHSGHLTAPGDGHSGDWTKTIDSDHHDYSSVGQHTSVKDLEEVMNRHLPAMTDNPESVINGDISSRYLRQKPTIQWIGSHPSGTDSLPASNLLRTLYANRESVIRSNVCNTRPQYYSDIPISMLTPPSGGDGYKEQTTHIKTGKTPESYVVVSSYTTTPLSVSMSNSLSDSYNITPPSSVSPQDKLPSPFAEGGFVDSTTQCGNLGNENLAVRIPIKPQAAYTLPITSEYDHAKNTFPVSGNSYLSTNSEFTHFNHISNSSASQIYDSQRPTGPWYSASYSA